MSLTLTLTTFIAFPKSVVQMLRLVGTGKNRALAPTTALDVFFKLAPDFVDRRLDRPSRTVGKSTDRCAWDSADRIGDLQQQVNVAEFASAISNAFEDLGRPSGPFAARSALTTRLMGKESASVVQDIDHTGLIIDHDHRSGP
jgi:hypothetical protein